MQVLPQAWQTYGWRKHSDGHCSYQGYKSRECPDKHMDFWETLVPGNYYPPPKNCPDGQCPVLLLCMLTCCGLLTATLVAVELLSQQTLFSEQAVQLTHVWLQCAYRPAPLARALCEL
jgi:hypothetical protein